MKLDDDQVRQFEEEGYIFLPELFGRPEVEALMAEVPAIFAQRGPEIVRERTGDVVRTVFAAHTFCEAYARLGRHPRLIGPAMQLLGEEVYVHQYKINAKAAFDGDVWQWHQDYGTWHADDEMPEARAMNLAVFLDDVTQFNGPLMLIPGSHKEGRIEAGHDRGTTSYPLWTIDNETISRLVAEGGLVAPTGPAGSGLFFHGNLVHGSPSNMSPFSRTIVYLSVNAVSNAIRRFKRPDYIAQRDFTPIVPLADDCLLGDMP
jgi:ectoine hydroxylase